MILQKEVSSKKNTTGIPTAMKQHLENASKIHLDDVHVIYNSDKPAKINASSFSQGENIYIGPGYQTDLQHELIHYIQKRTMPISVTHKHDGMSFNTTPLLEKAADHGVIPRYRGNHYQPSDIIQPKLLGKPSTVETEPTSALELVQAQLELQVETPDAVQAHIDKIHGNDQYSFTTVGFEYEFMQMDEASPIAKAIHATIGNSTQRMGFTNLPFFLETDASRALELVCPPFLIATPKAYSIPLTEDIRKSNDLMEKGLQDVISDTISLTPDASGAVETSNIYKLIKRFKKYLGIDIDVNETLLTQENYPLSKGEHQDTKIAAADILNTNVEKSSKGLKKDESLPTTGKINTQLNFAIDSQSYLFTRSSPRKKAEVDNLIADRIFGFIPKNIAKKKLHDRSTLYLKKFDTTIESLKHTSIVVTPVIKGFFSELADRLAQILIIPSLQGDEELELKFDKKYSGPWLSVVKDMSNLWLKDSLENIAYGALSPEDRRVVTLICEAALPSFIQNERLILKRFLQNFSAETPSSKVAFMHHTFNMTGVRQDTYIDLKEQPKIPKALEGKRGHIVEIRNHDILETLKQMHVDIEIAEHEKQRIIASHIPKPVKVPTPQPYSAPKPQSIPVIPRPKTKDAGLEVKINNYINAFAPGFLRDVTKEMLESYLKEGEYYVSLNHKRSDAIKKALTYCKQLYGSAK